MVKVGKKIAKHRIAILIIGFLLLIPSAFGYFNTRVNYDILYYLPDNIDTMKGQDAGVAKGTFYLYFKDKFEIRDRLIARTAEKLFKAANTELKKVNVPKFEDKIIFIVDYVLEQMKKNKAVLRFVSKNLSWGVFRAAIEQKEEATGVKNLLEELLAECPDVHIEAPDTMLFLIIELASSASYSTILDNDPVSYEELKPYLNASIRAIIKSHMSTIQRQ